MKIYAISLKCELTELFEFLNQKVSEAEYHTKRLLQEQRSICCLTRSQTWTSKNSGSNAQTELLLNQVCSNNLRGWNITTRNNHLNILGEERAGYAQNVTQKTDFFKEFV